MKRTQSRYIRYRNKINLIKDQKRVMLQENISRMDEQSQLLRDNADRLADIEKVYGVRLSDDLDEAVLKAYTKMNTEYNEKFQGV